MTKKNTTAFDHQYLLDNIPVAIFELQFHIEEQISRFNYLNDLAKDFFLKLLPKDKLETGFDLNEILDIPELQRKSMEDLIPIIKDKPLIFSNRQYLLNTYNGKQIVVTTDLKFSLENNYVVIRGIGKETSKVKIETEPVDIDSIKQEIKDFKNFFDAFDALIMIVDEMGRILFVSPNVSDDMLYKPRDKMLNKNFHEIFPKGQADFFLSNCKEAIEKNINVDYEYHLPIQNKVRWFQSMLIPIESIEGELRKVIAIIKDKTEWKIKPL